MSGTAIVADDDDDVRMLIEVAVRRAGYTILASHSEGSGALADALALDPDLLVLDHAMPGMTGGDVVRALRTQRSDRRPYAVLMSASVDLLESTALLGGADAHMPKPFSVQGLAAMLADRPRA